MIKNFKFPFSIIWGLTIVSSTFYARPLYRLIITFISREVISYIVGVVIVGVVLLSAIICTARYSALSGQKFNKQFLLKRIFSIVPALVIFLGLFYYLDLPEERIHLVLYSSLGYLRTVELQDAKHSKLKAVLFVLIFSMLSETVQNFVPGRFCDIRDLVVDTLSGVCGVLLWMSDEKKIIHIPLQSNERL